MISPGLYAEWRVRTWAAHTLAERSDRQPLTEQLLQLIWQYQRLSRDRLRTTDGRPVQVLHPGFWNHEAGPDFRGAVVQFGQETARHGDVEVDLLPEGWHAHGHDQNQAYQNVILHVVWEADAQAVVPLPTLPLKDRLDAPLDELALWLRKEPEDELAALCGLCSERLVQMPAEAVGQLLDQAAEIRLRTKAGQIQARARQAGWEQALWEGLFTALGYKNNCWPMQRLSEMLPAITRSPRDAQPGLTLQARLLGISGLLPEDIAGAPPPTREYLRKLWDVWWREREEFASLALPRCLWRLNGLRPANHPQRRLALAAHWVNDRNLPERLETWFANAEPDTKLPHSLLDLLQIQDDTFWSHHWTFRSPWMPEARPLVGLQRVTDIAMNVVLPWFWIRAAVGQSTALQRRAEQCYFKWPKAEDNSVLRLARRRLFGADKVAVTTTAARQQGLLQIVRDFCDYSDSVCRNCQLPMLLASTTP